MQNGSLLCRLTFFSILKRIKYFKMANKYYNRSKRREQFLVREAKKAGLIAIRSAGSKSPIDVIIIDDVQRFIQLIQVKTGYQTLGQLDKLYKEYSKLNGKWEVEFEVWHYP